MSFQPIVPSGGLVGWKFLERTYEAQNAAFQRSTVITRDTEYFAENISKVDTAEDLVNDRRLMRVALGAFGLQDDINNKYFIKKILEEGTLEDGALANKLSDDRYKSLASAFGFDLGTPRSKISTFSDTIIEKFRQQEFEVAVGEADDDMRLAMYTERNLADIATGENSEETKWFKIMGTPPLRAVFEAALNLPSSFAQLDLDQQLGVFQDRATRYFGDDSVAQFADPEKQEKLITNFLVRSQVSQVTSSSAGNIALTLLQSAGY
ncbi:DUF1217 domain-containing protein [Litorivita sp. NS0012-18]|uniref:DUF1217 domain-containing protein n=1 Tax=Litorivita sp. NS0012-18 TaxID=3127655 RepID=UPI003102B61A